MALLPEDLIRVTLPRPDVLLADMATIHSSATMMRAMLHKHALLLPYPDYLELLQLVEQMESAARSTRITVEVATDIAWARQQKGRAA